MKVVVIGDSRARMMYVHFQEKIGKTINSNLTSASVKQCHVSLLPGALCPGTAGKVVSSFRQGGTRNVFVRNNTC